jgi:hypothetical protein
MVKSTIEISKQNIIKECKNKVMTEHFKIFFIVLGLFALNTKIEGITKISLVNDFDHVKANFLFLTKKKS